MPRKLMRLQVKAGFVTLARAAEVSVDIKDEKDLREAIEKIADRHGRKGHNGIRGRFYDGKRFVKEVRL